MNLKQLKKIEGLQTVSSICRILNISRRTAINYVYELRKKGFVETFYGKNKIRMYKIKLSKVKEAGYESLYDVINKNSKVKLVVKSEYRIHDHKLSIEETIVRAILTKRSRVILACLGLFNKVKNWSKLYSYAKEKNVGRKVGALYDVSREVIKVRKINKRIRDKLLGSKVDNKYIINGFKSKDFKAIENKWRVYVPFNKNDLLVYKE